MECNNQLVLFHTFKRELKKYQNFTENIQKLDILLKAESFLDTVSDMPISIIHEEHRFVISIDQDALTHEDPVKIEEEGNGIKTEEVFEHDGITEMVVYDSENDYDATEIPELADVTEISIPILKSPPHDYEAFDFIPTASASGAKKNKKQFTNEDLSSEQMTWIKKQVELNQIKKGGKTQFKCPNCRLIVSSSYALTRHLRDKHILAKKSDDPETMRREAFRAEIKRSKMVVHTVNGPETIFRCQHCPDDKIYRSINAFKLHIRSTHIKTSNVDANFVNNCKTVLETEEGPRNAWACPYCEPQKVYRSRDCFKYHIKAEHGEEDNTASFVQGSIETLQQEIKKEVSINEKNTSSVVVYTIISEADDDENSNDSTKRKVHTLNDLTPEHIEWIRSEVKMSVVKQGKKNAYRCSQCGTVLATHQSLTRHLRDVHILKSDDPGSKEREAMKEEIRNSRLILETSVGREVIYKCLRCKDDKIYRQEQSLKQHLRMVHIRTTEVSTAFIASCKITIDEADGPRNAWRCPECERIFRNRDSLRNHIKIEHPEMNESSAIRRSEELRTKDVKEPLPTNIEDFDKMLLAKRLADKIEMKTLAKTASACMECGIAYSATKFHRKPRVHREAHETFKQIAPIANRFKCEDCRIMYNNEENLIQHMMIHDDPESIQLIPAEGLSQFGATFYKESTGDADDAVDEASWKCGHCAVKYLDENDCLVHQMLLHCIPLLCPVDQLPFEGSTAISKFCQHVKNKHPELFPDLVYQCPLCKTEFTSIYEKLAHQKTCDFKKFECDYCGKQELPKSLYKLLN